MCVYFLSKRVLKAAVSAGERIELLQQEVYIQFRACGALLCDSQVGLQPRRRAPLGGHVLFAAPNLREKTRKGG